MTTLRILKFQFVFAIIAASFLHDAMAERVIDEATITIQGEQRRYYRLHDSEPLGDSPVILLLNGSGCDDFAARLPKYFKKYPAPIDLYFLDKPHIQKKADGSRCSTAYQKADQLDRRVSDTMDFMALEPTLRERTDRSIAILGFSEGGAVAPIVASKSPKIGWLATAGGGGGLTQGEGFLVFAGRGIAPYAKPFSKKIFLEQFALIQADPDNWKKEFFGHSYRYWSSHLFYDLIPAFAKLDIPIVVAMGEKDESVPIESGRALQKYFSAHPERDFQFIEYPNANHGLQTPQKKYATTFVGGLARWFKGDPDAFNEY